MAWAKGDLIRAETSLRESIAHWLTMGAPLHAADVRLRLCTLLIEAGDGTAAELELGSAQAAFEQVGAAPLLERCRVLRKALQ